MAAASTEALSASCAATNDAYRLATPKNQEAIEEYDRIYDEADCIPY